MRREQPSTQVMNPSALASTNPTVDDDLSRPPLLSRDDFVLTSSYTETGTRGVILPKFWDGDADLFFRPLRQFLESGETDCLIKAEQCDGRRPMLMQRDFAQCFERQSEEVRTIASKRRE